MSKLKHKKQIRREVVDHAGVSSPAHRWLEILILPLLLLIVVFFVTFRPISDPDTWFHMALGKLVLDKHELPRVDPFAGSSIGGEWISSGWFASVLMEGSYRIFGPSGVGLLLLTFSVTVICYGLAWFVARKWFGDRGLITIPLLIALGLATVRFNPRPDIFSHLMLGGTLLLLLLAERSDQQGVNFRPWYLWLLLPLFITWSNLHAGFLVGLLVLLIYCAWIIQQGIVKKEHWRIWRLLPCLLCFVAVNLNPYGVKVWTLAYKIGRVPKVGWIMEWMPLFKSGFPMPAGTYLCGAALIAITIIVLLRTRAEWWRWTVVVLLVGLALLQRRQVGPAAIGLCVLLLPSLSRLSFSWPGYRAILIPTATVLAVLLCTFKVNGSLGGGKGFPQRGIDCTQLPCVATDFLTANRPPEKLFNTYALGGYLLYHLGPQTKVFIDGRLDVYDPKVYLDTLAVEENRLPIEELEKRYGTRTWVVSISDAIGDAEHLASRLAARRDIALVHFDDQTAVFVKRTPATQAYLAHEFRFVNPWRLAELRESSTSAQAEIVYSEIDRALAQSDQSANSKALAALVAASVGEPQTAQSLLSEAAARNPKGKLGPQVAALLNAR